MSGKEVEGWQGWLGGGEEGCGGGEEKVREGRGSVGAALEGRAARRPEPRQLSWRRVLVLSRCGPRRHEARPVNAARSGTCRCSARKGEIQLLEFSYVCVLR